MIGSIVSHYQIEEEIGRGGMGVVYRARDVRLDRTVALKFLTAYATDASEARERFAREAKTAARTEHPNVCGVYDIGENDDGTPFIAMPYYDGVNLAEQAGDRPLAPTEVLAIVKQVASGLGSVHVHGIVHRDIKPGNILVTGDGRAKILDFGLAKVAGNQTVTATGSTLGTFTYMSPEQIRGEKLDARTDIWSLGTVLYELLTGSRPFGGDYPEAVMYSVLNEQQEPLSAARSELPEGLETVVGRCLEKDRSARYQSMAELENDLTAIERDLLPAATAGRPKTRVKPVAWTVAGAIGVAAAAVVAAVLVVGRGESEARPPMRFAMLLPEGQQLAMPGPSLAISPDGSQLAFAAGDSSGTLIYIRDIDAFDARVIEGTQGGRAPFFSPSGEWIGFMTEDRLYRVSVAGGLPQEVADAPGISMFMRGSADWSDDDRIVFSTMGLDGSLFGVSSHGGELKRLTKVQNPGVSHHAWPEMLPSGRHLLYSDVSEATGSKIVALSLEDGSIRTLVEKGTRPAFVSPNLLVYAVGSDLFAVQFDPDRAEVRGDPVPVLHDVFSAEARYVEYAVSEAGSIVYAAQGPEQFEARLTMTSLSGQVSDLPVPQRNAVTPRASPDGRFVAFQQRAPEKRSLWVHDVERGVTRQLTDDSAQEWWYTWTPDSRRIIFNSTRISGLEGSIDLFELPVDGSAEPSLVSDGVGHQMPHAVTPDGNVLVYNEVVDGQRLDIFARSLEGREETQAIVASDGDDFHPSLSPDGRWLAFASNRSGRWEVYVKPFLRAGGVTQVSSDSGAEPVWAPDGRKLYYRDPGGQQIMSVDVSAPALETTEAILQLGRPQFLLEGPFFTCSKFGRSYDLTPDGKRFVVVTADWPGAERRRFNVVVNWATEVRERLSQAG